MQCDLVVLRVQEFFLVKIACPVDLSFSQEVLLAISG